jgi:hypothetical protein
MFDKATKNLERVKRELEALAAEYLAIFGRFRYVTLPFMKTRVPDRLIRQGYPDNNEIYHLLTAFVEELFDQAPRVCAYVAETLLAIYVIRLLV